MKNIILITMLALSTLFIAAKTEAKPAQKWTDWNCFNDCMERGSVYSYCKQLCEY